MARRLAIGRLRGGELLAGVGAGMLLVSLFLPWFGAEVRVESGDEGVLNLLVVTASSTGWDGLGWLVLVIATIAVACVAWLGFATVSVRPVTEVVAAAVLAATVGPSAFAALVLRTLIFQPGPNELTTLRYGAWIGLAGAALLAIGAWWSLADERTDAPESAYTPPAPRPAPPPASS
jgi:hypothetical protein